MRRTLLSLTALLWAVVSNANTFTVTATGDNGGTNPAAFAGTGTLRQAIIDANATAGADQISFNIPGAGVQTITLAGVLPAITGKVQINGYTQPGASTGTIASRTLMIELITPGSQAYGLLVEATGTEISGIAFTSLSNAAGDGAVSIYRNTGPATATHDVWIWGNYFNTNAAGTVTTGTGYGLAVYGNTSGAGAVSNLQNWTIGTNGDGVNDGLEGNLFSHPDPAIAPLAANNEPLRFFNCDNFVVAGNIIGLQKDGVTPIQTFSSTEDQNGALIATNCTGFRVGTNGDGVSDALERNVIAGMRGAAITFFANITGGTYGNDGNAAYTNRGVGNNLIAGNYIGTDITGLATGTDLQNRTSVRLEGTSFNQIGSETNAAMRNVLVNNKLSPGNGVSLLGGRWAGGNNAPAEGNRIEGNYIGVLADGTTASGNVQGIRLNGNNQQAAGENGVIKTRIANNVIANSTSAGINIGAAASAGVLVYDNTITQNSIYANGRLGINLASAVNDQAVSPNDGALLTPNTTSVNRMMDYGVVSKAQLSGDNLLISGYIGNNSVGTTAFGANAVVEFFIADNIPANQNGEVVAGDGLSKPHGEGRTYLGSLTADANGIFTGTLNVAGMGVTANVTEITNTATEYASTGSTSEFGANRLVELAMPVTLAAFSAKKESGIVQLNWLTTEEVNSDYFEIQHSTDGGSWDIVARIASHENSSETRAYQYEHISPAAGMNYYRLKMVDLDGTYAMSRMVNVHFEVPGVIAYPNPVTAELYFKMPGSAPLKVEVMDMQGNMKLVPKLVDQKVNLGQLPAGKYIVRVTDTAGAVKTFLVVR
jgi:hypothetical protein